MDITLYVLTETNSEFVFEILYKSQTRKLKRRLIIALYAFGVSMQTTNCIKQVMYSNTGDCAS